MKVRRVGASLACASMLFSCSTEPEPNTSEARAAPQNSAAQVPQVTDREIADLRQTNLAPARQVLAAYFALHLEGNRREAAGLWCDPALERPIGDRLERHRPYKTNNAAPWVRDSGARAGQVSISVQILGLDNSNNLDGTAYLARQRDKELPAFCITHVGLQRPPRILPMPAGNPGVSDRDEPPPPPANGAD